jgi:hypothetical protein
MSNDQAWWKGSTVTLGPHIRPWEMSSASKFWSDIRSIAGIFHISVQMQIGTGTNTQFWHDDWIEGPLKLQFSNLYEQANFKDISVAQVQSQRTWNIIMRSISNVPGANRITTTAGHAGNDSIATGYR